MPDTDTPKPQLLLSLANTAADRLLSAGKFMPFALLIDGDGHDHAITPQEVLEADRDIQDLDAYFDLAQRMVEQREIVAAAVVYGAMVKLTDEADESPAVIVHLESPGQPATSLIRPFTHEGETIHWQDGVAMPTKPLLMGTDDEPGTQDEAPATAEDTDV